MTTASYLETDFFVTGAAQTASSLGTPLNGSQPFTVDAWIRFGSIQDRADALFQTGVFRLGALGHQAYCEITGFPGLWSDGVQNPIAQDTWHYVAAVYDGAQLYLYIDGVLDCSAAVSGSGVSSTQPYVMGNNLQGRMAAVRVYPTALSAAQIAQAMLQPDPSQVYSANFDFTATPPLDRSPNAFPVSLVGNAGSRSVVPAVALVNTAYCQPIRDTSVNPGGQGNDAYTIQAWIFIQNPAVGGGANPLIPEAQAVLVNQSSDASSGIALFLSYDPSVKVYRLSSLRGALATPSNILTSSATIGYGQWTNVATTYDPSSSTLTLYVNGAVDQSSTSFGPIQALTNPELLIAGAGSTKQPASAWTLQGYIQSVDVWSTCLPASGVNEWQNGYPVMEPGLLAHYAFGFALARNENNGALIGLADRAIMAPQTASVAPGASTPLARRIKEVPLYDQLPPAQMAELRASISFGGHDLDRLLDAAMQRDEGAPFEHLFGPRAAEVRGRLATEWRRVREQMRENPQALNFSITYHRINAEHILIHHTPTGSTVVFRAPQESLDDCTMWRIRVIWTTVSGLLSIFGVTAQLTQRATQFIQQRILNNQPLMGVIANNLDEVSATGIFVVLQALHNYGLLWPLIKMGVTMLGWWALGRLLVWILTKVFGGPAALIDTLAALVVAAANMVVVFTQEPAGCPLVPAEAPSLAMA